jgi:hypothetical protein
MPYADDSVAVVSFEMDGWFARVRDPHRGSPIEEEARPKLDRRRGVIVSRNLRPTAMALIGWSTLRLAVTDAPLSARSSGSSMTIPLRRGRLP